jgi:hypothetical protein
MCSGFLYAGADHVPHHPFVTMNSLQTAAHRAGRAMFTFLAAPRSRALAGTASAPVSPAAGTAEIGEDFTLRSRTSKDSYTASARSRARG